MLMMMMKKKEKKGGVFFYILFHFIFHTEKKNPCQLGMSIIWGSEYLYKYQIVQIPKTQVLVSKTNS